MSDEELRRQYQDAMRKRSPDGPDTLEPELLLRVARGEATEAERLRVLDLVMQSEALRREYDTYRALAAAARPAPARWPRLLAAAVVLIVAGAGYWALAPATRGAPWRGSGSGMTTIAPSDGAEIAVPVHLVWHLIPGTTVYQIEIMEEHGRLIAQFATRDTTYVVPLEAGLRSGVPYRWGVTARGDRGESANSPLGRFTIRE